MTMPQQQQKQPLQVDVRHVAEQEAEKWSAMLAQAIRECSVLQVALRDRDAYVEELEARVRALGGLSAVPGAVPQVRPGVPGPPRPVPAAPAQPSPVPAGVSAAPSDGK